MKNPHWMVAALAAAWMCAAPARAQDGAALEAKAGAAYEAKDFAGAGSLFERAAAAASTCEDRAGDLYDAACSYALAGDRDSAFRLIDATLAAGYDRKHPADDGDFAGLHEDPRWPALMARIAAEHPMMDAIHALGDQRSTPIHRYAAGRRALAAGLDPGSRESLFRQLVPTQGTILGAYDPASEMYGWSKPVADPVALGHVRAVVALPIVLAQARGRQAVFLNENHGQSSTRAANLALLPGLRAEGFGVLALEALSTTQAVPRDATHCSNTGLLDDGLAVRGYAVARTGYYSNDPVYGELVREALRLGFRLVAYDSSVPGGQASREQNQAENLACVFKQDPKARLVVIGGFGHIAERKDQSIPGGLMAFRFHALTGIDPLTVNHSDLGGMSTSALQFERGKRSPPPVSYALLDGKGRPLGNDAYDLLLYVPPAAHRDDGGAGWLALGGLRAATHVAMPVCAGTPLCFVAARREGEVADAVPADACIVEPPAAGCTLFLPPGRYDVVAVDAAEATLGHVPVVVKARRRQSRRAPIR